jgi:hypothetical protein
MTNAFVDTTILADSLLKNGERARAARAALRRFEKTELPVYAIKEFKAGPLKNFCWFHNKLALLGSYEKALDALHRMSLTPKRYTTATAIEALKGAAARMRSANLQSLVQKYGKAANIDNFLCDQYRLSLKTKILKAWRYRRQVTTDIAYPLSCYEEVELSEINRVLSVEPTSCKLATECCLGPELRKRTTDLEKLRNAILRQPKSNENDRRSKALRQLIRKPKAAVSAQTCRDLGDAYFALFCPNESVILTTNTKDHGPLATALNKNVVAP